MLCAGSSSGIGAAAAIMFAERGGSVAIHGRRQEKLDEVAAKIEEVSGKKVSTQESHFSSKALGLVSIERDRRKDSEYSRELSRDCWANIRDQSSI